MSTTFEGVSKLPTGIPGFDLVANGGLPRGRVTLVSGTAGSAKTILAAQFLAEGIRQAKEPGVFVTFEESAEDIRRNMRGFGWDIAAWERAGLWSFVDASPQPEGQPVVAGEYDLGGLLARVEHVVGRTGARRACVDTVSALFLALGSTLAIRHELFRLTSALKRLGVTTLMTAERTAEQGAISRLGVEEFVTDNVVVLRNVLEQEKRRRTLEILKFRGTSHQKGEFPFTITPDRGVVVMPLSAIALRHKSSTVRVGSGNAELDAMCGGGFFRDSIILLSGPTGTGKTLVTTQFIGGGVAAGERCLLFAFEESREQLFRNAAGWGYDFERMERDGKLRVHCQYPEASTLEELLILIQQSLAEFRPGRVAIDSLSALERVSTIKMFREFVLGLTSFIKEQEVAGLFTASTPTLLGGDSITEAHISTITDSIILLRYAEVCGEMRRGLTVLKMRGSVHDKHIREFTIDGRGMHLGKPFRHVSGILSGTFAPLDPAEAERLGGLFEEGRAG